MTQRLKDETYGGFKVVFHKEGNAVRADSENNVTAIMSTKEEAFNAVKNQIDAESSSGEDWQKKAKKELEKELGVKTKLSDYQYYENLGAMALESTTGEANNGESEWIVFEDEDEAEKAAIEKVQEDLDNEPYLFSPSWLENQIDIDNLRSYLEDDLMEQNRSYYEEIADESYDGEYLNRQREELYQGDYITEEEAKDKDFDTSDAVEKATEDMTKEKLEDPIEYLKEIYSEEEAMKKAIEWGGIDDDAAQSAVDEDGVAHFLDGYDGEEVELPSGAVAYGTN